MSKSTNRLRTIFPFIDQLQEAKKGGLKHDLIAGTVIGIMIIPQGMAYALIAGLPPIYGLYSSLIPPLIYFILGTSRKLVIGPVAIDAMMAGQGLAALGLFYTESPETYITSVFILTMMIGVIQLAAGFLKLGFISNFLSEPVIKGFTTAAAFIIIFSQTDKLLGIETENTSLFHSKIWNTLKAIPNLDITG